MDASLDRLTLPSGALLFAEGEKASSAFIITSGRIEIFLPRVDSDVFVAMRGPGEIIGEMAILDSRSRSASARAVEDCELVVVTAHQINHRLANTDPVLRMCLGVVIARYREMIAMFDTGDRRQVFREQSVNGGEFWDALSELSLEGELRRALLNREFELFFQPIVHLRTRRLAGFEALLRWRHPTRGLVQPNDFIALAEASGIIVEITSWVLSEVGRTAPGILEAASNQLEEGDSLFVSMNVCGQDLSSALFVESLAAMLETSRLAPGAVKLEITESVVMKDPENSVEALHACRRLGLKIAIDDFGTGYSSLTYLSKLPIDTIKIDRSFVFSMLEASTSRKIIKMIIRLADELDTTVVAEGVETEQEALLLIDLGCEFAQGYLFGRPMPLPETIELTRLWRSHHECPLSEAKPIKKRAVG
jgi:EAL domain-containing protein (putative c-di-GMP-specific phosphodiesterase class I)